MCSRLGKEALLLCLPCLDPIVSNISYQEPFQTPDIIINTNLHMTVGSVNQGYHTAGNVSCKNQMFGFHISKYGIVLNHPLSRCLLQQSFWFCFLHLPAISQHKPFLSQCLLYLDTSAGDQVFYNVIYNTVQCML